MTMFKVCWKNEYVVVVVAVVVVVVSIHYRGVQTHPRRRKGGGRNAERAECRTHFRAECQQGGIPKQKGPEMKACSRQKINDDIVRTKVTSKVTLSMGLRLVEFSFRNSVRSTSFSQFGIPPFGILSRSPTQNASEILGGGQK